MQDWGERRLVFSTGSTTVYSFGVEKTPKARQSRIVKMCHILRQKCTYLILSLVWRLTPSRRYGMGNDGCDVSEREVRDGK